MRLNLIFGFILTTTSFNINSQSIEIEIIDSKTKNPIPYVNVYSQSGMQGSISNEEGKCIINNFSDTLTISHLAYKERKKKFYINDNHRSISLEENTTVLNETLIYSLDLKEKLSQISKNIKQFYETKPVNYYGTYKETFSANDSIRRLFQIQFEWHKKNGAIHNYKNTFYKQNQFKINNVDYSRILNDTIMENGGFVRNSYLFELLSINYYVNLILNYAKNISIISVKKSNDNVEVIFDCDLIIKGNKVSSVRNSSIYFNPKMDYINKIKLDVIYHNQIHEGKSRKNKIPYKTTINNHRLSIQFRKAIGKGRLSLNTFKTEFIGVASYDNTLFSLNIGQELLITSARRNNKRFPIKNKIDINRPFYDNIKEKHFKIHRVKFPLTQKESAFVNEQGKPEYSD